jgi:hypothetical protein
MCGRGGGLRLNRRRRDRADRRGLGFERGLQNDHLFFLGRGGGFQAIHEGMPRLVETDGGLLELIYLLAWSGYAGGVVHMRQHFVERVQIAQDRQHPGDRGWRAVSILEQRGQGRLNILLNGADAGSGLGAH